MISCHAAYALMETIAEKASPKEAATWDKEFVYLVTLTGYTTGRCLDAAPDQSAPFSRKPTGYHYSYDRHNLNDFILLVTDPILLQSVTEQSAVLRVRKRQDVLYRTKLIILC